MVLLQIECLVACILFTVIILPPLYINPLSQIMSYPTSIRKRVESLPEYKNVIRQAEKKHIFRKIIAAILFSILLAVVAYYSGATTFKQAFGHVFILFCAVNIYDMLLLDLCLFCHSTRVVIHGTEDMIDIYRSPWHHVKGAIIGTALGAIVALCSAGYIQMITIL